MSQILHVLGLANPIIQNHSITHSVPAHFLAWHLVFLAFLVFLVFLALVRSGLKWHLVFLALVRSGLKSGRSGPSIWVLLFVA